MNLHWCWLLVLGVVVLLAVIAGLLVTYDEAMSSRLSDWTVDRTGSWVSLLIDRGRRLLEVVHIGAPAMAHVWADFTERRQTWRGTGAAMTDASVEMMTSVFDVVRWLFDLAVKDGVRLSWVWLLLMVIDMFLSVWIWGWDGAQASLALQA